MSSRDEANSDEEDAKGDVEDGGDERLVVRNVPRERRHGKRGLGSQLLTLAQVVAFLVFATGSITMGVLTHKRAGEGKGELPLAIYTTSGQEKIVGRNVSPGTILAVAMGLVAFAYGFDILMLYREPFKFFSNLFRKKNLTMPKTSDANERRFDSNRQKRQYLRIMLTWPPLMFVMHMAVGEFAVDAIFPLALLHLASIFLLGVMESEALGVQDLLDGDAGIDAIGNRAHNIAFRAAGYIGAGSLISVIFSITAFTFLWVDYHYNKDDAGSFVRDSFAAPMYILTIGYFVYWFMAMSTSNQGMTKNQSTITWWFTVIPGNVFAPFTRMVMDQGIVQEAFVLMLDFLFFGVVSWIVYRDVVAERITLPI